MTTVTVSGIGSSLLAVGLCAVRMSAVEFLHRFFFKIRFVCPELRGERDSAKNLDANRRAVGILNIIIPSLRDKNDGAYRGRDYIQHPPCDHGVPKLPMGVQPPAINRHAMR